MTNSGGDYALPTLTGTTTATVSWMGQTLVIHGLTMSSANCTTKVLVCYCSATVNVTSTSGSSIVANNPSGSPTFVQTGSSGNWTFTFQELILCSATSALPTNYLFRVIPPSSGYLDNCAGITINCDDNITLPLPCFYFEPCYVQSSCYQNPLCPPSTINHTLLPLNIQVTPKTVSTTRGGRVGNNMGGSGASAGSYFASDEGQAITVPFVGINGSGQVVWDTGCRGGQGNFVGCPRGTLNGLGDDSDPPTPMDSANYYSGTRIIVIDCVAGENPANNFAEVIYYRYGDVCPPGNTGGGFYCPNVAAGFWIGCSTSASSPITQVPLSTLLDQTFTGGNDSGNWSFEIKEVACVYGGGGYGAPMSMMVFRPYKVEDEPVNKSEKRRSWG